MEHTHQGNKDVLDTKSNSDHGGQLYSSEEFERENPSLKPVESCDMGDTSNSEGDRAFLSADDEEYDGSSLSRSSELLLSDSEVKTLSLQHPSGDSDPLFLDSEIKTHEFHIAFMSLCQRHNNIC